MPEQRKWRFRIRHIQEAIDKIQEYVRGMTYEQFRTDSMGSDAVIRNLMIIGEAVNHVPKDAQNAHPELPWALMSGMRNVLVHEYDRVKLEVVWRTIHDSLPPLIPLLKKLSEELPQ